LIKNKAIIDFAGNSLPEDVNTFYQPILDWIDKYVENPNEKTEINMRFDYYNTSSSR
jgi:hypothetical protein